MKAVTSCTATCDVEIRDLERLLEAFGSFFSLEDIASAYCQARRNIDVAGEILCASQGNTSDSTTSASKDKLECASQGSISHSATCASKDKLECASSTSSELSSDLDGVSAIPSEMSSDRNSYRGGRNTRALKSKVCSVSMGTVSGIIGKEYVRTRPVTNEFPEATKPPKLDTKELPISEIWSEKAPPTMTVRNGTISVDVEEFMFKMLGDGFQLDKKVIREVLGICGYDVQKSIDKLLDLSASTLEKCDDVVDLASEKSLKKCQDLYSAHRATTMTRDITESPKSDRDRLALQKEVLEALFSVPERSKEAPKRMRPVRREVRRSRAFGEVVVEPYIDTTLEHNTATAEPLEVTRDEDEDDENSFKVLRKGVKEYWVTMKEYYKAAVDAFAKGDHARVNNLLEQGHFFNRKAREADEKSTQKLLETSQGESDDVVSIDLCGHQRKEALCLLRLHLTSLSGIPGLKYLRVIVGTSDEDATKEARKRLILKQLEKESIKWTEEGDGWTISIQVDILNPKRFGFSKK